PSATGWSQSLVRTVIELSLRRTSYSSLRQRALPTGRLLTILLTSIRVLTETAKPQCASSRTAQNTCSGILSQRKRQESVLRKVPQMCSRDPLIECWTDG